jgi:chaperonin cofactor prefoldin
MKMKTLRLFALIFSTILILGILISCNGSKVPANTKIRLEERVIALEKKVNSLENQIKELEKKIENPKTKIIPLTK